MANPERQFSPEPNQLPPDLVDFLKDRPVACLLVPTNQGTVMAIKIPRRDIESASGIVPIRVRHELITHPAAPVIRIVTTIYDKPRNPLAMEMFVNVEDPQQKADYEALAEQNNLYMLFYDESVTHRLTKEVENAARDQIRTIVSKADELLAAIPKVQFDFDKAKADVVANVRLSDAAPTSRKEREPQPLTDRDLRRFRPEIAQQLLPLAEKLTGIRPIIKRTDNLPNDNHGVLRPPEAPNKPWELIYLRGQERFMEHIIANEIGKIVRLYQVPPEERLQMAATPDNAIHALDQLMPELMDMLFKIDLPMTELHEMFNMWHQNLCTQLASYPSDLRIEQWMYSNYPGLRVVQERSLLHQVQRSFPLFEPGHRLLTPPIIFRANMSMNAAQAWQVANLYKRPDILLPFREHGFIDAGRHLARLVFDAPDEGHRSDIEAVKRWAKVLNLEGWFEWEPYERANNNK